MRSFPDVGREELIRFFTLRRADLEFVDNRGRGRGPEARMGLALQLCTLPWLGFIPDDLRGAPRAVVIRLANQLALHPGVLDFYGRRPQTRSDHLRLVAGYLGWRQPRAAGAPMKELEQFLLDRAMEHDAPSLLFALAREYLIAAKVIRPGLFALMDMVGTARAAASELTSQKVGPLLTVRMRGDLDGLLEPVPELRGMTRLTWLTTPAVEATAPAVLASVRKLEFLRGIDAHVLDLSMLPVERRRFLATVGRRSTTRGLMRREERRYPILLTLMAQSAVDQLDEVVALFDRAVSGREGRAKARTEAALAERARRGEARQVLMELILPVLADPSVPDERVGGMLRESIGMQRLREISAEGWRPLPRDHGRLSALAASYSYLRQFTPEVLAAVDFTGGPGTADLMDALAILRDLNRSGGRKVPADAPSSFVPPRYADYLTAARRDGDETAFRHYWELCVILALRDGLRSGDVFVPGSRRYADPGTYLFTLEQWRPRRDDFCALVGKPPGAAAAIERAKEELHQALTDLEAALADAAPGDVGTVRLDEEGRLVIPPLSAEDVPAEAKTLRGELANMLPFVPISALLIELDGRTGFLDAFTHAGGHKTSRPADLKRNLLAVLLAGGTNLGLTRMAEACGVSYDVLAWTSEWYLREDALREASNRIVNHHHGLDLSRVFGGGTMSSSDGQRFPVRGKTLTGAHMSIHGGLVLSSYTHVSDQWSPYGTMVIMPTAREAHYTLDEFLGTEYYSRAIADLRGQGRDVPDELLSHISPGRSDNINLFGTIDVDIDAELARLDGGWRPLRPTQLNDLGLSFLLSP
ncbi:hypothetical protein GCM10010468_42200 [Actinocorallia longicatena]|uniref:TnpA family transposase n=1 Tax=Actinocorallia longicatena TaxID=111803 RepID=A0ABP6QEQ1_9ACTN